MRNLIFVLQINVLISNKLISVYFLNRHGARGPMHTHQNSKDFFGNYISNKGQLHFYGERMLYILGLYNKFKYIYNENFLNKTCDPNEIYIFSSFLDRTFMSSQSEILGLCNNIINDKIINKKLINFTYPPINIFNNENMTKEIEELNKENFSLPNNIYFLPVNSYEENNGKFLLSMNKKCRSSFFKIIQQNMKKHKIILDLEKEFNVLYREKFNKFKNENKYYLINDIFIITDQYISSIYSGINTNEILYKLNINPNEFLNFSNIIHYTFITYFFFGDEKGESYKIEVSLLLKEIINRIKENIYYDINKDKNNNLNYTNKKLNIGSCHDTTLMGIQIFINNAFKLYNNTYSNIIDISYGGSLTFEIYKDEKNKNIFDVDNYYIDYLINDKFIKRFKFIDFYNIINNFAWNEDDIDKFCYSDKYALKQKIFILKGIIVFLVLFILLLLFFLFKKKCHIENKDNEKESLLS